MACAKTLEHEGWGESSIVVSREQKRRTGRWSCRMGCPRVCKSKQQGQPEVTVLIGLMKRRASTCKKSTQGTVALIHVFEMYLLSNKMIDTQWNTVHPIKVTRVSEYTGG